jgi:hypothetical protein
MRTIFSLALVCAFAVAMQAHADAGGINSTAGTNLPIGAGSQQLLLLTATRTTIQGINYDPGTILFGPDTTVNAWINTNTGKAVFNGPSQFGGLATFNDGLSITNGNLTASGIIYSGSQNVPGGLVVGSQQNQMFGSLDGSRFGLNIGNKWGLVLNDNGNVGINTLTPLARLDVNGDGTVSGVLTVSSLTIPGTAREEALDAQKMNNIINISDLPKCTGTGIVVLTKNTDNTFACISVPSAGSVYNGTFDCSAQGKVVVGFVNGQPRCGTP